MPLPDLIFYQGTKRFSFGAEPEQWLTDVPDGKGGRAEILEIEDEYWSCRGFLLYVCVVEGSPGRHLLYRYDDALGDSELICMLSPKREPRFFALDNDYSPGFFVNIRGVASYAFFSESGKVVVCGQERPYYACPWGYAAFAAREGDEGSVYYPRKEPSVYYFHDGTEVPVESGGRVVSAGEEKVLFVLSGDDERLAQYDKATGETTVFDGDYSLPRGQVAADRPIGSSSQSAKSPFLWTHDYTTRQITIVSFADGEFVEHRFSYKPRRYSGVVGCWWIVSSDIFLVTVEHFYLKIDLSLGTIEELPLSESGGNNLVDILPFDRTVYENDRYRIIERYKPSAGRKRAAYFVLFHETNQLLLLQKESFSLLFYQKVMERGS